MDKYIPVEPMLGLPAIHEIHNENRAGHESFLQYLGLEARVKHSNGHHFAVAKFVKMPAAVEKGQWLKVDGQDYSTELADGTAGNAVGVCMATIDPVHHNAPNLYGWIIIKGRVSAQVEAAVVDGDPLFFDNATPGIAANTGAIESTAIARSDYNGTSDPVPADPENIAPIDPQFAEIEIM